MLRGRGGADWCRRFAVATLVCWAVDVQADGLQDMIKNLWPDGIHLKPTPPPFPSHTGHFTASSLQGLDSLNTALATSLANFSPSAAAAGFTFDVERGIPTETEESLGPLVAERAPTIGKGKLNVAVTYTNIKYSIFEGTPLSELTLEFHHQDLPGNFEFEKDTITATLDTAISEQVVGLFATYGITPKWDVGVVVPLEYISMSVAAHATINRNSAASSVVHNFDPSDPNVSPQDVYSSDSASGIGDVLVRTKYNFLRGDSKLPDMSVVGWIRLPTGNESDLLGTGETTVTLLYVASKAYGWFTPHLNLGYGVSSAGSSENTVPYVLGFDARLGPRATLAADFVGLWKPQGDGVGDNLLDFALGLKVNLVRNFLIGANVAVPVNKNEGLRANVIWSIGAEYTF
jgi:Putative MetA-pathway of phenol degradation